MSNELIKEKIVLNQNIGKESTQVLMEGDIIVPDIKPDMSVILKTDAEVYLDKTEVLSERINIAGKLGLKVLYLAKGNEKAIHSISIYAPIDDFINMEGVHKDMMVSVRANISNIEYRVLNDRKIGYRAVIDVTVSAEEKYEYSAVTGITDLPETQIKKNDLNVTRTIEQKDDRFIVKDELSIPPGKPNIREILQTSVSIANKEVRVTNGKVNLTGELLIATLYKGDDDESIIEFIEHELSFNGAVDVSSAKDGMFADATLKISDTYVQARPDSDGEDRVVEIEVSVAANVSVTGQMDVNILEDAYCINKNLVLKKEPVLYPKLICRNKNQTPVKEIVSLDENAPDMLQIFRVSGVAQLDEVKILDDKVVTEGVIHTDILYIANNDDTPLYNYKTMIPYKQTIETKGASLKMSANVELSIDHVGFNMLSEKEVEIRFMLSFNTQVTEQCQSNIISDIEFLDIDKSVLDRMASMVIYVVQPGDTMWSIAKRYNASLEELIAINDLEDPNKIYPGQKLIVIKKLQE